MSAVVHKFNDIFISKEIFLARVYKNYFIKFSAICYVINYCLDYFSVD